MTIRPRAGPTSGLRLSCHGPSFVDGTCRQFCQIKPRWQLRKRVRARSLMDGIDPQSRSAALGDLLRSDSIRDGPSVHTRRTQWTCRYAASRSDRRSALDGWVRLRFYVCNSFRSCSKARSNGSSKRSGSGRSCNHHQLAGTSSLQTFSFHRPRTHSIAFVARCIAVQSIVPNKSRARASQECLGIVRRIARPSQARYAAELICLSKSREYRGDLLGQSIWPVPREGRSIRQPKGPRAISVATGLPRQRASQSRMRQRALS